MSVSSLHTHQQRWQGPKSIPSRVTFLQQHWDDDNVSTNICLDVASTHNQAFVSFNSRTYSALSLQLVYQHLENASAEHDDPEAAALKLEEESLLRGGNSDYVSECASVIEGVHTASVVAVRLWPGKDKILSGAGGTNGRLGKGCERHWLWRVRSVAFVLCTGGWHTALVVPTLMKSVSLSGVTHFNLV